MTYQGPADQVSASYTSWQSLRDDVDAHDGVLPINMHALRQIAGKSRLKSQVVAGIGSALTDIGLGHIPQDLPRNQNGWIILFRRASDAGAVIGAVRGDNSTNEAIKAMRLLNTSQTLQVDKAKDAKLAEATAKVDELEKVLKDLREILAD